LKFLSSEILFFLIAASSFAVMLVFGLGLLIARVVMHPPSSDGAESTTSDTVVGIDIAIRTVDDLKLGATLISATPGQVGIVAVHGGTNDRADFLPLVPALRAAGFTTLLLDMRGHGTSESGRGITLGIDEQHDVAAAVQHLRDSGCERVGGIGASLGASACLLAAASQAQIDALVLQSAGFDLEALLGGVLPKPFRPLAGIYARILLWRIGAPIRDAVRLRYPQPAAAALLAPSVPVLFIHGEADEIVSLSQARELKARVKGSTELWVIEGQGHELRPEISTAMYAARVSKFFRDALDPPARGRS
jgi:pimeloyl-ACP methyl ester carboxylesterase